jgi:predicted deacetylase
MEGGSVGLVVSVHDIAPSTLPEVRWLLARLDELEVVPRVLKVIPRASEVEDVRRHPDLIALLGEEVARGSEIVLHGLTHRLPPEAVLGGRTVDRLRARCFAGSAAEFLGLDDRAAEEAVLEGRAILRAAGFEPLGFCAPGWLARPSLSAILRRVGFRYACWFGSVEDLRTGRRLRAPAWGYMGVGGVGEGLVGLEGQLVRSVWHPLLGGAARVFLHPQGAPRSRACAASLRAIGRLRRSLRPTTYRELLDGWRG